MRLERAFGLKQEMRFWCAAAQAAHRKWGFSWHGATLILRQPSVETLQAAIKRARSTFLWSKLYARK